MDKFAKLRDDNLKESNRRFRQVVEQHEDVAELIAKKMQHISTFDNAILSSDGFIKYTDKIKELNEQLSAVLMRHDLPANYLDPIYTCAKCEDKGIIYEDNIMPVRCPFCNTESDTGSITFADFSLNIFSKEKPEGIKFSPYEIMEKNLQIAKDYCNSFPNCSKKNLLFFGASGLGKSFLASCICSAIGEKGYSALRINAFSLIDDFKAKHLEGATYAHDYYGCDFLAIDDIGTEPMYNNITVEYLFALINERMERGKATLYITNQDYASCAARYDERLASRIFDERSTIRLAFVGENRRLSK